MVCVALWCPMLFFFFLSFFFSSFSLSKPANFRRKERLYWRDVRRAAADKVEKREPLGIHVLGIVEPRPLFRGLLRGLGWRVGFGVVILDNFALLGRGVWIFSDKLAGMENKRKINKNN
jgi:hypothetical protein